MKIIAIALAVAAALAVSLPRSIAGEPEYPTLETAGLAGGHETVAAISVFGIYDVPNSGSDSDAWGGGLSAEFDLGGGLSAVASYAGAWGDSGRDDRHTVTAGAKFDLIGGDGSMWALYASGGPGIQRHGSDTDTLLYSGIGAELYLTDTITSFAEASYVFNFDEDDFTRISLGVRWHF